ncbi:MAG: hypothetical protein ACKOET_07705, partial [Verrucomicrobiota bacterium]
EIRQFLLDIINDNKQDVEKFSDVRLRQASVLSWTGAGFVLQQNPDLGNPAGWVNAPSGTANPATNAVGTGNLFFRLRWP